MGIYGGLTECRGLECWFRPSKGYEFATICEVFEKRKLPYDICHSKGRDRQRCSNILGDCFAAFSLLVYSTSPTRMIRLCQSSILLSMAKGQG